MAQRDDSWRMDTTESLFSGLLIWVLLSVTTGMHREWQDPRTAVTLVAMLVLSLCVMYLLGRLLNALLGRLAAHSEKN